MQTFIQVHLLYKSGLVYDTLFSHRDSSNQVRQGSLEVKKNPKCLCSSVVATSLLLTIRGGGKHAGLFFL